MAFILPCFAIGLCLHHKKVNEINEDDLKNILVENFVVSSIDLAIKYFFEYLEKKNIF